jgi:hypothetical protein
MLVLRIRWTATSDWGATELRPKKSAVRLTHKSQDRSQLAANQRIAEREIRGARLAGGRKLALGSENVYRIR